MKAISHPPYYAPIAEKEGKISTPWTGWIRELYDYVRPTAITVADLPAAASTKMGTRAFVSDATVTTFASVVAGGGANPVPVYCDATNWRIG